MDGKVLLLALGLMLIFEGIFPFAAPANWRQIFIRLLQLADGQLRFMGLMSMSIGLLLFFWAL